MSSDCNNMSLQDWTEHINSRLDVIYKELCDFEETISAQAQDEPEQVKLLDLLDAVNEIYQTAQNMRPVSAALKRKQDDLQEQMALLERSVDLLKLDAEAGGGEAVDHAMQEEDCIGENSAGL